MAKFDFCLSITNNTTTCARFHIFHIFFYFCFAGKLLFKYLTRTDVLMMRPSRYLKTCWNFQSFLFWQKKKFSFYLLLRCPHKKEQKWAVFSKSHLQKLWHDEALIMGPPSSSMGVLVFLASLMFYEPENWCMTQSRALY